VSDALHVLAFPHTQTTSAFATCAYTQRVVKFCRMMTGRDRKVILYSGEFNEAPCDEHVVCVTEERRQSWFGPHDEGDLERGGFDWNPSSPWWSEMNARAVGEIAQRADPHDIICLSQGRSQQLVADSFPQNIVAEIMVGYEGILAQRKPSPAFCAFESQTHRALVYGINGWRRGREYDVVIPNQFDPDELPAGTGWTDSGGYLLFMGRLIMQKQPHVAAMVAEALDMKLIVAGPGATDWGDGWVRYPEGESSAPGLEYVGPVGIDDRAKLMGGAAVTLMPTVYIEPFGGVAVESMMCGTPVVTTDFGAFTETVREGVSGFRFQTLQEAVDRTFEAISLDRDAVRDWAISRYSLDAVAPLYERWFANLDELWGEGWAALRSRLVEADAVA
jgi:glycosyltransferase involved in cell wall biosynthesis